MWGKVIQVLLAKSDLVNLEYPKYSTAVGLLLWDFANNLNPINEKDNYKSLNLPKASQFGKWLLKNKGVIKRWWFDRI